MCDYDENWENFRAECKKYMRDKEESLIKTWLINIGYRYSEPVGYYNNIIGRELVLYSKHVAALIGKGGEHVRELKKMLHDEFGGEWKVNFVEVLGGFVNV